MANNVLPIPLPVDVVSPLEVSGRGSIGVPVYVQDQTSPVITTPFLQDRSNSTLAVDAVVGSNDITLTTGHGTVVGEEIEIALDGSSLYMQSEVLAVNVDVVTLDSPVNYPYPANGTTVVRSTKSMLVNGSIIAPQIFSVLPLASQSGDMVRIILEIRGQPGQSMDFTTFGSDPALLNGCVLRVNNGDGTYKNLFNFKSNSDFLEQGYDYSFLEPKGGNSITGFTSRVTWGGQSKHGVVIRLDGSLGESIEVVIQDDLASGGNTRFHLTAQGHELQG